MVIAMRPVKIKRTAGSIISSSRALKSLNTIFGLRRGFFVLDRKNYLQGQHCCFNVRLELQLIGRNRHELAGSFEKNFLPPNPLVGLRRRIWPTDFVGALPSRRYAIGFRSRNGL